MILRLETLDGHKYSFGEKADPLPCFRCGLCCTGYLVKLTSRDIRALSHHLGITTSGFVREYTRRIPLGLVLKQTDDMCVFLSYEQDTTSAGCAVYASRPEVCQSFVPSLHRGECLAGLKKLGKSQAILPATEIYPSQDDTARLYSILKSNQNASGSCTPLESEETP
jgi:Fe-S-cluster containining protein